MDEDSFWNLPAWSKLDELKETNHMQHIVPALEDALTHVEEFEREEYILYGPEEALLFRPHGLIPRLAMTLYCNMMSLLGRN